MQILTYKKVLTIIAIIDGFVARTRLFIILHRHKKLFVIFVSKLSPVVFHGSDHAMITIGLYLKKVMSYYISQSLQKME